MRNLRNNSTSHVTCRFRQRGMTLMELMIVVVIVGILAAIAFPSYKAYVDRAKRTEGKTLLMEVAARQERYYFDENQYTTTADELGYDVNNGACTQSTNPCSDEENYSLTIAVGATGNINTSYLLTITPLAPHTDSDCGTLTLDSRSTQGSGTGNAICWDK